MLKIEKYAAINLLVLKGGDYGKFNGLCVGAQVELSENKARVDCLNFYAVGRKDKQGKTEVKAGLETHFWNGVTVWMSVIPQNSYVKIPTPQRDCIWT